MTTPSLGIPTEELLERSNITLVSETIDTKGVNPKALVFDSSYVGTFPSAGADVVSSPVIPTVAGDQDIIEQLDDGTNYLTRIRIQATGLRVIWKTIKITWAWTSP
jgi:hypothetical protein